MESNTGKSNERNKQFSRLGTAFRKLLPFASEHFHVQTAYQRLMLGSEPFIFSRRKVNSVLGAMSEKQLSEILCSKAPIRKETFESAAEILYLKLTEPAQAYYNACGLVMEWDRASAKIERLISEANPHAARKLANLHATRSYPDNPALLECRIFGLFLEGKMHDYEVAIALLNAIHTPTFRDETLGMLDKILEWREAGKNAQN